MGSVMEEHLSMTGERWKVAFLDNVTVDCEQLHLLVPQQAGIALKSPLPLHLTSGFLPFTFLPVLPVVDRTFSRLSERRRRRRRLSLKDSRCGPVCFLLNVFGYIKFLSVDERW